MAIFAKKQVGKRKDARPPSETVTIDVPALEHLPGLSPSQATSKATPHQEAAAAAPAALSAPTLPTLPTPPAEAGAGHSVDVSVAGLDDVETGESIDLDGEMMEPDVEPPATTTPGPPPFRLGDAIRLMRSLPTDANPDLVVRVVRLTLGAVDVSVQDIMKDAFLREQALRENLVVLRGEAAELEKQLVAKQRDIATREGELEETAAVYERLRHAEPHASHRPPPPPEAALSSYHKTTQWAAD